MKKYLCTIIAVSLAMPLFGCAPKDAPSTKIVAVTVGDRNSYAIDASGGLWAWGDNEFGQIGDGTITTREESPNPHILDNTIGKIIEDNNRKRPVKIMDSVISVSAGGFEHQKMCHKSTSDDHNVSIAKGAA